jgi:hypothetical protein
VQDPPFFELAERTIIAGGKQLPRQLTPLKPLTLALLRLTDLPLRGELYARPDAALAPELLKTKAAEEDARLMLAERSAQRGLIDGATLGDVYRSQTLAGNEVLNPTASHLTGAQRHALFYQAALQEKKVRERVDLTLRMLQDSTPEDLNGVLPRTAANLIGDVQPTAELNAFSAGMARLYILAGKSDLAQAWLKQALAASATTPKVTDELQPMWPLIVIAGLESNDNYPKEREAWLADALKSSPDARAAREGAASVLLLLDALGFAVTEEDWAKVADAGETEKRNLPPALILERLRAAGTANRRGETVLMALLAEGDKEPAFAVTLAAIRALRQAGLTADAAGLAREEIVRLTAGLSAKP